MSQTELFFLTTTDYCHFNYSKVMSQEPLTLFTYYLLLARFINKVDEYSGTLDGSCHHRPFKFALTGSLSARKV